MAGFKSLTWEEAAAMSWPEFRDYILDADCLQTVNIKWWKEQWERARAISNQQQNKEDQ